MGYSKDKIQDRDNFKIKSAMQITMNILTHETFVVKDVNYWLLKCKYVDGLCIKRTINRYVEIKNVMSNANQISLGLKACCPLTVPRVNTELV